MGQVWYLIVSTPDLCTLTYFVTDTYIQCISRSLLSLTNIHAEDNLGILFNSGECKKMGCLNVNSVGQNMGEEIYSHIMFINMGCPSHENK